MSVGITLRFLLAQTSFRYATRLAASMLVFAAFVGVTYSGFAATYSRANLTESNARPLGGELDAAMEFDNAARNLPRYTDMRLVAPHPPYMSRATALRMSAVLPPASLLHPGIALFRVRDFPATPIHALYERLAWPALYFFPGIMLCCCAFLLLVPSSASLRLQVLFWAAAAVYLLVPVLTLYLDSESVSLFPLAAVRRTFPYSALFYWIGIYIAITAMVSRFLRRPHQTAVIFDKKPSYGSLTSSVPNTGVSAMVARGHEQIRSWTRRELWGIQEKIKYDLVIRLGAVDSFALWLSIFTEQSVVLRLKAIGAVERLRTARFIVAKKKVAELGPSERASLVVLIPCWAWRRWRPIVTMGLIPLWFVYSINRDQGGSLNVLLGKRVVERLSDIVRPAPKGLSATQTLKPLFDAVAFIRDRTAVGELVYSNISSDSLFWYLSSGRVSLLDGANIYQLFFVQHTSACRIRRFADFARTADIKKVDGFNFKFVLLYKRTVCDAVCYDGPVFAADLKRFDENPLFKRVFDNPAYVIYERTDLSAGSPAALVTASEAAGLSRLNESCYDPC